MLWLSSGLLPLIATFTGIPSVAQALYLAPYLAHILSSIIMAVRQPPKVEPALEFGLQYRGVDCAEPS